MNKRKLAMIFVSFILLFSACSNQKEENTVLKINDTEIKESEFKLYYNESRIQFESVGGETIWETDFGGKTADDVAKETAINGIKMIKVAKEKANELNISLTDEEKKQAEEESKTYFESYEELNGKDTGVTEEDVKNFLEEKALFNKVYENITGNFKLDENDFNEYFKYSKDELSKDYVLYNLSSIKTATKEEADKALSEINAGTEFSEVFNKYETDKQAISTGGKMEIYRGQLEQAFNIVFDYKKDEISPVISAVDGFYIFKVDDVKEASEEELKSIAKSNYTVSKKEQLFSSEYEKWSKDIKVEINNDVLKNISL